MSVPYFSESTRIRSLVIFHDPLFQKDITLIRSVFQVTPREITEGRKKFDLLDCLFQLIHEKFLSGAISILVVKDIEFHGSIFSFYAKQIVKSLLLVIDEYIEKWFSPKQVKSDKPYLRDVIITCIFFNLGDFITDEYIFLNRYKEIFQLSDLFIAHRFMEAHGISPGINELLVNNKPEDLAHQLPLGINERMLKKQLVDVRAFVDYNFNNNSIGEVSGTYDLHTDTLYKRLKNIADLSDYKLRDHKPRGKASYKRRDHKPRGKAS